MSPRQLLPSPFLPAAPRGRPLRNAAALVLHGAALLLGRVAQHLAAAPAAHAAPHLASMQLEFHAEAGAPEGALYVDGRLVALLPGVTRL